MNPIRIPAATWCVALLAAAAAASAQPAQEVQARQRYEREVAACNSGTLAAPAREACIRAAGVALDRALGGPPAQVTVPSADGRATIVTPAGAPPPSSGSDAVPSRDGRATIVLPADRPASR
jgi:ABC-type amino acid transport substrate-binding protein